jgi:hypothetical protein
MQLNSIWIRVSSVEKVVRIGRVCLGLEDAFDAVCAADTHGKSYATYENVHIILRGEEAVRVRVRVRYRRRARQARGVQYLGSMRGLSYTLADWIVIVPEL